MDRRTLPGAGAVAALAVSFAPVRAGNAPPRRVATIGADADRLARGSDGYGHVLPVDPLAARLGVRNG